MRINLYYWYFYPYMKFFYMYSILLIRNSIVTYTKKLFYVSFVNASRNNLLNTVQSFLSESWQYRLSSGFNTQNILKFYSQTYFT